MARLIVCGVCGWVLAFAALAVAADDSKPVEKEDPIHNELRAVRDAVVKALNSKDLDGLLKHVHPNVTAVWQNAEVSRGHKGVREYSEKHLLGPNATLESYTVEVDVAELAILYGGDTAVAHGMMTSHFKFKNGSTIDVKGPWSATLVKEDGRWLIASSHASVGIFDNPLVATTTNMLYWGCGIAAVIGLVLGVVAMSLLGRGKKA